MKISNRQKCRVFFERILKWISNSQNYRRLIIESLIFACIFGVGVMIVKYHTASQFRVVYSLDARHNDQEIIKVINDADKYVYFAIYYFTKNNIADALVRAKKRGLIVWGITDNEASLSSNKNVIAQLRAAGISVETQKHEEGIMHMKVVVTDNAYVSGSYNWTASATNVNDEVLEIGTNESVRKQYLDIVQRVLVKNQ